MSKARVKVGLATVAVMVSSPVAGQQIVDLPAGDRTLAADLQEVFRIGSFDGDVWETFGEIAGVAFDAAGRLYVLDRQASRVTVVDPDGRFVRPLGQEKSLLKTMTAKMIAATAAGDTKRMKKRHTP